MSERLPAGVLTDASTMAIVLDPVDAGQVVSGTPRAGFVLLDEAPGRGVGVWEHTPGVSRDVEDDEVFVVLAGSGVLSFKDATVPAVELRPGAIVRLEAGMRTVWTVHETLRKVFIAP